jgi:hypothetical protein
MGESAVFLTGEAVGLMGEAVVLFGEAIDLLGEGFGEGLEATFTATSVLFGFSIFVDVSLSSSFSSFSISTSSSFALIESERLDSFFPYINKNIK